MTLQLVLDNVGTLKTFGVKIVPTPFKFGDEKFSWF